MKNCWYPGRHYAMGDFPVGIVNAARITDSAQLIVGLRRKRCDYIPNIFFQFQMYGKALSLTPFWV